MSVHRTPVVVLTRLPQCGDPPCSKIPFLALVRSVSRETISFRVGICDVQDEGCKRDKYMLWSDST
jgi:hypothetical protein